jgi:hypothetical protein
MRFLKQISLSIFVFLSVPSLIFPQDDVFEEIGRGLEQPKSIERKPGYLSDFFSSVTDAKNYVAYKEVYLSGKYSCDLKKIAGRNSLGFLLFGTFPGQEGQLGDLNVQGRAAYYNNPFSHGQLTPVEGTRRLHKLKWELHNAYLRIRALPPLCNIRVGHFYVPFGLQPWIDTHGTLLQGPAMGFIGMERDWGISMDGQNDKIQYQVGLTRGSGMEYFRRNNNFALAGKLSTPRIGEHVNEWVGISCLVGRIYDPMATERLKHIEGNIVQRWRVGFDGQKYIGPTRVRFEVSGGKDARKERILGEFLELQHVLDRNSKLYSYFQFENLTQNEKRSDTTVRAGLTYVLSANYNLQFVVSKDLNVIQGRRDTWVGFLLYGQI